MVKQKAPPFSRSTQNMAAIQGGGGEPALGGSPPIGYGEPVNRKLSRPANHGLPTRQSRTAKPANRIPTPASEIEPRALGQGLNLMLVDFGRAQWFVAQFSRIGQVSTGKFLTVIWWNLVEIGRIWSNLVKFGRVWCLVEFGRIWLIWVEIGRIWSHGVERCQF